MKECVGGGQRARDRETERREGPCPPMADRLRARVCENDETAGKTLPTLQFVFSFYGLVDVLTIAPYFWTLAYPGGTVRGWRVRSLSIAPRRSHNRSTIAPRRACNLLSIAPYLWALAYPGGTISPLPVSERIRHI